MAASRFLFLFASLVTGCFLGTCGLAPTESREGPVVRLAELEIDSDQLEAYKAALKEEIEAAIRTEPGVLSLYAVSIKNHATQIRIFETYANPAAYEAHRQTAHFKKYKSETQNMVKSLRLVETDPILLGSKTGQH
ncbi:MAG: putative quinol monooxygenase [Bryobacteraceae bacterium]